MPKIKTAFTFKSELLAILQKALALILWSATAAFRLHLVSLI